MKNADNLADGKAPAIHAGRERCLRCGASDAVLRLLTSMTRYFACRRCDHRWQASIVAGGIVSRPHLTRAENVLTVWPDSALLLEPAAVQD